MDREAALKLLSAGADGVRQWNAWRTEERLARRTQERLTRLLDLRKLSDAKFSGADLGDCNLRLANLRGAILIAADLTDADLSGADLSGANLSDANLKLAHLRGANFSGADLSGAKLSGADLSGADLSRADLSGATLSFANLSYANFNCANLSAAVLSLSIFAYVDLSFAKGLDSVRHRGPSTIGLDTLRMSNGAIADEFLRGCGLAPWELILARIYRKEATAHEISELQNELFDLRTTGALFIGGVFISHSHADSNFVEKIEKRLKDEGVAVWRDVHDLVAGPLERQVSDAIRVKDTVLLVLSQASIDSDWVEAELEEALKKQKEQKRTVLCPVALDESWKVKVEGSVLWRQVKKMTVLDFSKWKTKAFETPFEKLLRGLKKYYAPTEAGT